MALKQHQNQCICTSQFPLLKLTVYFHHQNMRDMVSAALICYTLLPDEAFPVISRSQVRRFKIQQAEPKKEK